MAIKKEKEQKEPQLTDLPGIGPAVSAKLESAGVYDLMSLAGLVLLLLEKLFRLLVRCLI